MPIRLVHVPSGRVLADNLETARTPWTRMRGLLGRSGLEEGAGMLIERCSSIHTFFMKFAIDVLFLDAEYRVRKAIRHLDPWRFAAAFGAAHVVELPADTLGDLAVSPGDALEMQET